jgi:hypothetical protein
VIAGYGRALDWFLDRAWLTVPILIVCILGLWFFFNPFAFHVDSARRQRLRSRRIHRAGRLVSPSNAAIPSAGEQ